MRSRTTQFLVTTAVVLISSCICPTSAADNWNPPAVTPVDPFSLPLVKEILDFISPYIDLSSIKSTEDAVRGLKRLVVLKAENWAEVAVSPECRQTRSRERRWESKEWYYYTMIVHPKKLDYDEVKHDYIDCNEIYIDRLSAHVKRIMTQFSTQIGQMVLKGMRQTLELPKRRNITYSQKGFVVDAFKPLCATLFSSHEICRNETRYPWLHEAYKCENGFETNMTGLFHHVLQDFCRNDLKLLAEFFDIGPLRYVEDLVGAFDYIEVDTNMANLTGIMKNQFFEPRGKQLSSLQDFCNTADTAGTLAFDLLRLTCLKDPKPCSMIWTAFRNTSEWNFLYCCQINGYCGAAGAIGASEIVVWFLCLIAVALGIGVKAELL